MARKFLTPLDLVQNELQNARVQNLSTAPTVPAPVKGQLYFNSSDNTLYWYDGALWQPAKSGAPAFGSVPSETTFGIARADGVATTVARSDHTHGSPAHSAAEHSTIPINSFAAATGDVSIGGPYRIINMAGPNAATDAVNKGYVDGLITGMSWKSPCRMASTVNLTWPLTGLLVVDGITAVAADRVLVKNQTTTSQNGIWVAASGAWVRATDADAYPELENASVFISAGTTQADTAWVQTLVVSTVLSDPQNWIQFAGAGSVIGGSGLTQTGNTLNVGAGLGVTVNADDVAVTWAGNGAANTSARSDHNHDTTYPPIGRTISTTAPLTGGGALSANLTLAVSNFTSGAAGTVPASGGVATNYLSADGTWKAVANDTTAGDARWARKYTIATIGGAVSQVVTHNLNTQFVTVNVFRTLTPWDTVECDVERTSVNTVTLRFTVAPGTNEYSAVVLG